MKPNRFLHLGILALLASAPAVYADTGVLNVNLHYSPQESVGSDVPSLLPGISDRPVQLKVRDNRTGPDPAVIGDSSDDDDKVWPVRAGNDVPAFALQILERAAADWGIRVSKDAPLTLAATLTRFRIVESNKAVGSTYNGDVSVTFTLQDAGGRTLWEGTGSGDATRYGKARSGDNISEVLTDAAKEAYAAGIASTGLQEAWLGKPSPASSAGSAAVKSDGAVTPESLLAELVKLKGQGFKTDLLVDFVKQKSLSRSLSADDLAQWKKAGMPEEVISAALSRAQG